MKLVAQLDSLSILKLGSYCMLLKLLVALSISLLSLIRKKVYFCGLATQTSYLDYKYLYHQELPEAVQQKTQELPELSSPLCHRMCIRGLVGYV